MWKDIEDLGDLVKISSEYEDGDVYWGYDYWEDYKQEEKHYERTDK